MIDGSLLEDESGKNIGKITSIVNSPKFGVIGLGLVRKNHANIGKVLNAKVPAVGQATVALIPFSEC